ncbi:lipase family protein [Nonomuraea sp. NPDC050790]|uniref:lipase family protein n=1 Tax=Nonomuraea sp. NPDC050790 TaxID=3364371 RepID=UPI0037A45B59
MDEYGEGFLGRPLGEVAETLNRLLVDAYLPVHDRLDVEQGLAALLVIRQVREDLLEGEPILWVRRVMTVGEVPHRGTLMTTITFDHAATGYSVAQARCLAHAAALAYKDEHEIQSTAGRWGFDRVKHFRVPHAAPFPLEDTQAYVAAGDQMIIVAFRGTQPEELRDWLSDANALLTPYTAAGGNIHAGFYRALDVVQPTLLQTLEDWHTGQSLWFTGHSLGGALAMLAAARTHFEDPTLLADGVYTYGQPRTCCPQLAAAYDEAFAGRTFRFVNNNDIVAQLPPAPLFGHVDEERYFDADGRLHEKMPPVAGLLDRLGGATADPLAPGTDGIRDHFINAYLARFDAAQQDAASASGRKPKTGRGPASAVTGLLPK